MEFCAGFFKFFFQFSNALLISTKYLTIYFVRFLIYHNHELQHIIQLAHDKGVPVELSSVDLGNYKVCGIIKNLADM